MTREAKRDAKDIVKRFTAAIRGASIYTPQAMREAAAQINATSFDEGEAEVANAFVRLLMQSVEAKERIFREAFGPKGAS